MGSVLLKDRGAPHTQALSRILQGVGWKSTLSFEVSDAFPVVLEKPKDRILHP